MNRIEQEWRILKYLKCHIEIYQQTRQHSKFTIFIKSKKYFLKYNLVQNSTLKEMGKTNF